MTLPLEGIRILDLSRQLPGPYCTLMLGDLGAEVIKIEEPAPRWSIAEETDPTHLALDRNKKSIALNLKTKEGKKIFYQLAREADVILESFRPEVKMRLAIDYESIKKMNPKIIYCSLSGYGQDGPYRNLVGHDINYIAIGGVLDITGESGGPPIIPGVQIADLGGGGMLAAIGILTALIARQKTGRGQFIDVAMLDGVVAWLSIHAWMHFAGFHIFPLKRGEMVLNGGVPCYNVYETKDGKYITIGALEPWFWENLCNTLGREDFIPYQFATGKEGMKVRSALEEIFLTKNRDEWVDLLKDKDVCVGPVNTIDEVFTDLQVLHRKMLMEMDHPKLGKIKQIGIPIKFSDTAGRIRSPPPSLGQHTEEILQSLGYGKDETEELRKKNVIR